MRSGVHLWSLVCRAFHANWEVRAQYLPSQKSAPRLANAIGGNMICHCRKPFCLLKAGAATTAILAAVASFSSAGAAEQGNWVPTWAASPQPVWEPDFFAPVGIPRSV